MSANCIDTGMAKRMVEAAAVRGASIVGQPGGWSVMIKIGLQEKPLGVQRTDKPRVWRSLDRCVDYLKNELRLVRFDMLDASNHSEVALSANTRKDTSERMRRAHEAAAYDAWFRKQVQEGIDDPRPAIPHEEVFKHFEARRAELKKAANAS